MGMSEETHGESRSTAARARTVRRQEALAAAGSRDLATAGVVHREVREVAAALGADGVEEDVVGIEHGEVRHLLLRHHCDRGAMSSSFELSRVPDMLLPEK